AKESFARFWIYVPVLGAQTGTVSPDSRGGYWKSEKCVVDAQRRWTVVQASPGGMDRYGISNAQLVLPQLAFGRLSRGDDSTQSRHDGMGVRRSTPSARNGYRWTSGTHRGEVRKYLRSLCH